MLVAFPGSKALQQFPDTKIRAQSGHLPHQTAADGTLARQPQLDPSHVLRFAEVVRS
jgi:hypothetical protein